ncbi:MAG: IS110 family transposase [Muribaculaceae bacterium]|nr:IS110 family transposase [Muribaculaceae bacterium]
MKDLSTFQDFVGCDVSKSTLDFSIHARGMDYRQFEHIKVENSPEGFQAMRKWLRSHKIDLKKCVIAMEHTGMYSTALAEWCFKKGIAFVFLHPLDVKNACARGRNKTDKADSQFIADYVYTMREKLTVSEPEPASIKRLRALRNERQMAVRSRTAYMSQLKTTCDKDVCRRISDMIEIFTAQIRSIEATIKSVIDSDEQIKQNYELMISIPGIGLINAVTTIIATCNFTRFQTSRQYAKFCCVSPLSRQSGISVKGGDHVSRAGHNEIKSILTEAARSAICHDRQLREYYQRKRQEGKTHGCVLNAVKFKLICRIFAVVQRKTPYANIERFRC